MDANEGEPRQRQHRSTADPANQTQISCGCSGSCVFASWRLGVETSPRARRTIAVLNAKTQRRQDARGVEASRNTRKTAFVSREAAKPRRMLGGRTATSKG